MPEARIEDTDHGRVVRSDGWFVLNARDARWVLSSSFGDAVTFEGDTQFPELGINVSVLQPGQPACMYHWENAQEDFLVLDGEALLIVEGEERPLRKWDFVHSPAGTPHVIVGAGDRPCVVLAVGARPEAEGGAYPRDETALRHGAGVEREAATGSEAYAGYDRGRPGAYPPGALPD